MNNYRHYTQDTMHSSHEILTFSRDRELIILFNETIGFVVESFQRKLRPPISQVSILVIFVTWLKKNTTKMVYFETKHWLIWDLCCNGCFFIFFCILNQHGRHALCYWCTLVYNGVQWCTMVYNGVQWCTLVYIGVHWWTLVYIGVHCGIVYIGVRCT